MRWALVALLTCTACSGSSSTTGSPNAGDDAATAGGASSSGGHTGTTGDAATSANTGSIPGGAPRDSIHVHWVGHSLISHTDRVFAGAQPLPDLLRALAEAAGQGHAHYADTTPGAPLAWNWGHGDAWQTQQSQLQPLLDPNHPEHGNLDVMVVTESVPVGEQIKWWSSSFYARRFFCAARRANPDTALYVYESWPHFQAAGGNEYASVYGTAEDYDFVQALRDQHALWVSIVQDAADPARTAPPAEGYVWQGEGDDPGECDGRLEVHLVPTGAALASLIERMREQRAQDDWRSDETIAGERFTELDLWQNPLTNFPEDTATTAHGGDLDDIHPSHALAYFNALVHYATLYRRDPRGLPALNGVAESVATIMRDVAWQTVLNEPLSGVSSQ